MGGQNPPSYFSRKKQIMQLNFEDIWNCFRSLEMSFRYGRNLSSKHSCYYERNQKDSRQAGMKTNARDLNMNNKFLISFMAFFLVIAFSQIADASDTGVVTVSATILSKNQCKFSSASAALAFGILDPANPVDKTVSTSVNFRCMGSSPTATFFITDDDGLHEISPNANRMRHTTIGTEYLPYTFTLNPTSGTVPKNTVQILTISGLVNGTDYQDAAVGNYSDTVIITLEP